MTRLMARPALMIVLCCLIGTSLAGFLGRVLRSDGVLAYFNYPPGSLEGSLYALDVARGIRLLLLERVPIVIIPVVSPDGAWLAHHFAYNQPDDDIFVIDLAAATPLFSDLRLLTQNDEPDQSPTWSPDSQQLLFLGTRSGSFELFTMSIEGGEDQPLTSDDVYKDLFVWSPDGRYIAYRAEDPDGCCSLYLLEVMTRQVRLIVENGRNIDYIAWLRDSQHIAFIQRRQQGVEIVNIETGAMRLLASDAGFISSPTWSPDGSLIAYTVSDANADVGIYVMNADGTGIRRITDDPGFDLYPAWLP